MMILTLILNVAWSLTYSQPALEPVWESVVQIQTEARDKENYEVPAYCNATFLHPQILITAAHCVAHAHILKKFDVKIDVGNYKYTTRPDGQTVRVGYVTHTSKTLQARFYFTPELERSLSVGDLNVRIPPQHDIVLIILDSAFPLQQKFPFAKVVTQSEASVLRKKITSHAPTVVSVNFLSQMSTDTKRIAQLNDLSWNSAFHYVSKSTSRVEEGDSGAPLFVKMQDYQWALAAVVKGKASTLFSNWDVLTAVDTKVCIISKSIPHEFKNIVCR